MSANSLTLQTDAATTDISVVAGTDVTFTPDGVTVPNGLHLADAGVADFRVRPSITLKTRNPQLRNGVFTKAKRWITITQPRILADLTISYDVVRIEIEQHPESTAAQNDSLVAAACQTLFDADLASFRSSGSLA